MTEPIHVDVLEPGEPGTGFNAKGLFGVIVFAAIVFLVLWSNKERNNQFREETNEYRTALKRNEERIEYLTNRVASLEHNEQADVSAEPKAATRRRTSKTDSAKDVTLTVVED